MNLFDKARKEAVVEKKTEEPGTTGTVEIQDLHQLASIGTVIDALNTLYSTLETKVKATMVEKFVELGMQKKHQPANFEGAEKDARASCQLKKRSNRSALKPEEMKILDEHGISTEDMVTRKEAFVINPRYMDDQKLLAKISKKLSEIKDLPDDFIQLQTEISSKATTNTTIEEVFAKVGDIEQVRTLIHIVASPAIKFRLENGNIDEAIQLVTNILTEK